MDTFNRWRWRAVAGLVAFIAGLLLFNLSIPFYDAVISPLAYDDRTISNQTCVFVPATATSGSYCRIGLPIEAASGSLERVRVQLASQADRQRGMLFVVLTGEIRFDDQRGAIEVRTARSYTAGGTVPFNHSQVGGFGNQAVWDVRYLHLSPGAPFGAATPIVYIVLAFLTFSIICIIAVVWVWRRGATPQRPQTRGRRRFLRF